MFRKLVGCCIGMFLASSAAAQSAASAPYSGDRLSFPTEVVGYYVVEPQASAASAAASDAARASAPAGAASASQASAKPPRMLGARVCIPARTALRAAEQKISAKDLVGREGLLVYVSGFKPFGGPDKCPLDGSTDSGPIGEKLIFIEAAYVNANDPDRFGLVSGLLAVPFKYHLSGSKEFLGGGAIGLYMGYRFDRNALGLGTKLVGFAGPTTVSVTQNVDGVSKSQSLSGFSYGLGLIGELKNGFQVGLVFGKDHVSKSAGYIDNGKTWLSISLGFEFAK